MKKTVEIWGGERGKQIDRQTHADRDRYRQKQRDRQFELLPFDSVWFPTKLDSVCVCGAEGVLLIITYRLVPQSLQICGIGEEKEEPKVIEWGRECVCGGEMMQIERKRIV